MIMKKVLFSLLLILVTIGSGCSSSPKIELIWVKGTQQEIQGYCQSYKAAGCYRKTGNTCIVYAKDWDFHTLGHEVKHCFDGAFH